MSKEETYNFTAADIGVWTYGYECATCGDMFFMREGKRILVTYASPFKNCLCEKPIKKEWTPGWYEIKEVKQ